MSLIIIIICQSIPKVFDEEEEGSLVEYLIRCCHIYHGLSITELKKLAYEFARKIKRVYPSSWDKEQMAGKQWYYGFMLRHKNLSLRSPEQTSQNRIRSFCKENVDEFFNNLSLLMELNHFEPQQIWNMDETGFPTVPTKVGKIIAPKGLKRVGQSEGTERGTLVSMALSVSATGNSVPPYFVFPRKNMQTYFMDSAPSTADAACNESGWFHQVEFVKYMRHFIKYTNSNTEIPTLLLLDNHTSHLSIEAIDLARNHGVHMLSFPPHCSHKMQPLDVSVFAPVKAYYAQAVKNWQMANAGKAIEIRHISGVVCKVLDQALTPANIKAGFAKTGICPFDRNAFPESEFVVAIQSDQSANAAQIENSFGEEMQRRIHIVTGPLEVAANEEVASSEPSTSAGTPNTMSRSSSYASVLSEIGPVQPGEPKKKSNRGRKPMKSTVLTSTETVASLKEKQNKRDEAKQRKAEKAVKRKPTPQTPPVKKRTRSAAKKKSSSDEDIDFCLVCMKNLPAKLTKNNSIECNLCKRPFHLKCANMTRSYFTCRNCDSDADLSDENE